MPKIKQKFEFPCGYIIEHEFTSMFFIGHFDVEDDLCPIHKEKCK